MDIENRDLSAASKTSQLWLEQTVRLLELRVDTHQPPQHSLEPEHVAPLGLQDGARSGVALGTYAADPVEASTVTNAPKKSPTVSFFSTFHLSRSTMLRA